MKRWMKALIGVGTAGMAFVGLVGFAHTPAGRPLLNALRGAPGCPVDLDGGDPKKVEAFRIDQLRRRGGEGAAPTRQALGFVLGTTTQADAKAWAEKVGADCKLRRSDSVLSCGQVPALPGDPADGPRVENLHLQFDPAGRLVVVDAYRASATAPQALAAYQHVVGEHAAAFGPAHKASGREDAAYLASKMTHRTAATWNFQDYAATVSVMNYGKRGIRMREQYQWAPEVAAPAAAKEAKL